MYCLRYHDIVTVSRLTTSVALVWICSFIVAILPFLSSSKKLLREQISDCIESTFYVTISIIMLTCSLYIRNVRNTHELEIRQRNVYFGITEERLHVLQRLTTSVVDVIKLNVMTSVLVIAGIFLRLLYKYVYRRQSREAFAALLLLNSLYVISNPVLYAFTMTGLKSEYKKTVKGWVRRVCSFLSCVE